MKKKFDSRETEIVESGVLLCSCKFLFPIVDSVPRMLIESFIEYEGFLEKHMGDYSMIRSYLFSNYNELIRVSINRNNKTKSSFSLEWSLLKGKESSRIWRLNTDDYRSQLFKELDMPVSSFGNTLAIDIGCGHGRSAAILAELCKVSVGMDLGLSVVKANLDYNLENCHFVQGDLHYPPFAKNSFGLVYSSGVLHHTADTQNAFRIVSGLVKKGGTFCIWLYKPSQGWMHKTMMRFRKMTVHLPLALQFWLYRIFLVPVHKTISWFRGKESKSWREIMVELFDTLSPVYRFEHEPAEVEAWFKQQKFTEIKITTENDLGFSIKGSR